jgi:hypothetical protein
MILMKKNKKKKNRQTRNKNMIFDCLVCELNSTDYISLEK